MTTIFRMSGFSCNMFTVVKRIFGKIMFYFTKISLKEEIQSTIVKISDVRVEIYSNLV